MNAFRTVALQHASRLVNHGPTVLVTSAHGGRRNVMAAAWSMPVEFTPPRIAVVIDKKTFTRELVAASGVFGLCLPGIALAGLAYAVGGASGAFGLCIPGLALVDLTYAAGSSSGREGDKFARHGIVAHPGPVLGMPVMESGCSAWLECRLIPERHTEDAYDTCFGEVVAAAADARIFEDGHWNFRDDNAALQSIHHLGAGLFVRAGGTVRAAQIKENP
jgi:flavin reductase (DIM6/NTAB) family NADH-FMN oxidoreductase RutF